MTLVEFLTARLDEDEAWARADLPRVEAARREVVSDFPPGPMLATHPARVLREVGAKRAIVKACAEVLAVDGWEYRTTPPPLAEETLVALAKVYSDHPDHDGALYH